MFTDISLRKGNHINMAKLPTAEEVRSEKVYIASSPPIMLEIMRH